MKLNEKIARVLADEKNQKKNFYSFEYFPARTVQGIDNLLDRIERMALTNPLWIDVTWSAGGTSSEITLEVCCHLQNYSGVDVMMHLTCTYMTREKIIESLDKAKEMGIRNILALRGDPPRGATDWVHNENGFNNAIDLVRFIRENYGDHFCIGVAGYPEIHLQAQSPQQDIQYLKEKVDAGADFIITQLFYDNEIFYEWVAECRSAGINCLIIPGVMPILGYERFNKMLKFTKTKVPKEITDTLELYKNDDAKVQEFGVEYGVKQTTDLMKHGFQFIHYYTMNLETSVLNIIDKNGTVDRHRALPWSKPTLDNRSDELVRPIFWANKTKSYISRTATWDNFPNGRWGSSVSPAFKAEEEGFVSFSQKPLKDEQESQRKLWGANISNIVEVSDVFVKYVTRQIKKFPFSEGALQVESNQIRDMLTTLNSNMLLTINSQPMVNGVKSTDSVFGWGPENGYIYQRAYFEFFIPEQLLQPFVAHLKQYEMISFQAANQKGDIVSNVAPDSVNAVTWGVFPNSQVVQPTVVDFQAFIIWKDEAFNGWRKWASIYPQDSQSFKVLNYIRNSFYLMNIVDNDYIGGQLNQVVFEFLLKNSATVRDLQTMSFE